MRYLPFSLLADDRSENTFSYFSIAGFPTKIISPVASNSVLFMPESLGIVQSPTLTVLVSEIQITFWHQFTIKLAVVTVFTLTPCCWVLST